MKISGIYQIVNKINGKIYYGSSSHILHRFSQHKHQLNKNIHINLHLQSAWNVYGNDSFEFNICENVDIEKLKTIEQLYLDKCKSNPEIYYNMSYDASATGRGMKKSKETIKKISISKTGIKPSIETREKTSKSLKGKPKPWFKGRKLSDEHKQKISIGNKGKSLSEESRMKVSKNHSRFWKGKHLSEETKQKMRESHLKRNKGYSKSTVDLLPNPTPELNPFGPLL